jgi:hypothetical protein
LTFADKSPHGLLYTHNRLNANARQTREAAAYIYALIELLDAKGLVSPAELEPLRESMEQTLVDKHRHEGNGVAFQDPEQDKYTFAAAEIDCAGRVHLCKASLLSPAFRPLPAGCARGRRPLGFGPALSDRTRPGRLLHAHGTGKLRVYNLCSPARALPRL